ncbi:MAG: protoheme IX farnesyltransferase [Acidobacteriota bacterium]
MTTGNSPLICHPLTATARTPGRQDAKSPGVLASWRLCVLATLTKFPIAFLSTLSAATGYVVFCRTVNSGIATASLGVLLLAMGASSMNQFQDRDIDARMERTRRRPIPAGDLCPAAVFAIAVLLVIGGFSLLWWVHNLTAALLGLFAVVWYNGVYTYLKRISAFAVVPGALIGALPPVIGWTAGGGSPLDPKVFALAFFFFIWQVPHFWLLLFKFGEDYERAGLPSLTKIFGARQLASLTFIWMLATSASSLLLPIYFLTSSPWVTLGLIATSFWLAWKASGLMRGYRGARSFLPVFRSINLYALLIMLLLVADAML